MDSAAAESEPLAGAGDSSEIDHRQHQEAARWPIQQVTGIKMLLIFVPLGLAARGLNAHTLVVSMFNFLALIPLSALISDCSDKLSDYWGPLTGGLINATFGNAVELIVGILSVNHRKMYIAQATMLGSILSDILLVLGACLIVAARKRGIPKFNEAVADALSSLMIITAVALILPTTLFSTSTKNINIDNKIQSFSRATAVVLLVVYAVYLYFQLHTHKAFFLNEEDDADDEDSASNEGQDTGITEPEPEPEHEGQPEMPSQFPYASIAMLVITAAATMICTQYFIDSLDATGEFVPFSNTFIAMILIPIASNAPEFMAIISASRKQRINYAIGVIAGSILQISLFVLPILVIIGWVLNKPMTLYFETYQTSILFLAVLMVNHLLQDGKYTYLHGIMLLSLYAIVAVAIFIHPAE